MATLPGTSAAAVSAAAVAGVEAHDAGVFAAGGSAGQLGHGAPPHHTVPAPQAATPAGVLLHNRDAVARPVVTAAREAEAAAGSLEEAAGVGADATDAADPNPPAVLQQDPAGQAAAAADQHIPTAAAAAAAGLGAADATEQQQQHGAVGVLRHQEGSNSSRQGLEPHTPSSMGEPPR